MEGKKGRGVGFHGGLSRLFSLLERKTGTFVRMKRIGVPIFSGF